MMILVFARRLSRNRQKDKDLGEEAILFDRTVSFDIISYELERTERGAFPEIGSLHRVSGDLLPLGRSERRLLAAETRGGPRVSLSLP